MLHLLKEEERIKAKKAALKRVESLKAAAPERGHDSPLSASTCKAKATPNAEGSTSKEQSPVKNKVTTATSTSAKAKRPKPQPNAQKAPIPTDKSFQQTPSGLNCLGATLPLRPLKSSAISSCVT